MINIDEEKQDVFVFPLHYDPLKFPKCVEILLRQAYKKITLFRNSVKIGNVQKPIFTIIVMHFIYFTGNQTVHSSCQKNWICG